MIRRTIVLLGVLGLAGIGAVVPASAASPRTSQLTLDPNSGAPGDPVTMSWQCSKDDGPVRQLWSNVLTGFPANPHTYVGTARAAVRPDVTPAGNGNYWVALDCQHSYSILPFTVR
ncbi:hypothetical protein [Amycolatopsis sp. NPDC004079]|uniref:hypothetical protein n=1 Tax=Amycolatopsis sp. NPDC004079 TaxID=3154549 RepID=UPI0033A74EA5